MGSIPHFPQTPLIEWKWKKLLLVLCLGLFLFSSCAEKKTLKDRNGKEFLARPYGLLNPSAEADSVVYEASMGTILCSVVFVETIFAPVWGLGFRLRAIRTCGL